MRDKLMGAVGIFGIGYGIAFIAGWWFPWTSIVVGVLLLILTAFALFDAKVRKELGVAGIVSFVVFGFLLFRSGRAELSNNAAIEAEKIDRQIASVERLLAEGQFDDAIRLSVELEPKATKAQTTRLNQIKLSAENEAKLRPQRIRDDANSKVSVLFDEAIEALEAGDIATSQRKLEEALATPNADNLARSVQAKKLSEQIQNATNPFRIHEALLGLSDDDFQQLRDNGTMPPRMITDYVALNRRAVELVKADIAGVAKTRDAPRLAKLEKERAELRKRLEKEKLRQQAIKKVAQKGGTWQAFNAECGLQAITNNEVKSEALFAKNWQEKTVDWNGKVVSVTRRPFGGGYAIMCKMPGSDSLISDVYYSVPATMQDWVESLKKGMTVRIQGKIVSQGGAITNHMIDYEE